MPRVIGLGPTNLLSRTMAPRGRGYTPTCIAKKVIGTTQCIGIVEQGSPFAENLSMRNGSAS
jgi:hypothetical protein